MAGIKHIHVSFTMTGSRRNPDHAPNLRGDVNFQDARRLS
jgi:hypothetical protein